METAAAENGFSDIEVALFEAAMLNKPSISVQIGLKKNSKNGSIFKKPKKVNT